ncbi:hypothetical protein VTI74DRAFT_10962 [Chaetomium olivicolor]
MSDIGTVPRGTAPETRSSAAEDATHLRASTPGANSAGRDHSTPVGARDSQPTASSTSAFHPTIDTTRLSQLPNAHQLALSRSNSQGTSSTNDADPVFTPPASGGRLSPGTGSAHGSSQESQLLQLSQIAAAQERIPEPTIEMGPGESRKRMADGMVKHSREKSNVSPVQMASHSRNTSTISVASTSGSRIGELSAELKARLSYAMVKVNHGWQSHSIDQVETLASQAASPASSTSTIHLRNGSSSASPQLSAVSHRASHNTTPATAPQHQSSNRPGDPQWRESPHSASRGSSTSPVKTNHGLAPPVSIQPSHNSNPRREPNPRQIPPFLSSSQHASPRSGLHTSPYLAPGRHRSAITEAMLVSPHTNVREQTAIESLLFMSSPGNSANLKHAFPSSLSQPLPSPHPPQSEQQQQQQQQQQRHALPTSQPRKSLPSGRPPHHARSQSQSQPTTTKRVGFEKSPTTATTATPMDIDHPSPTFGSPMSVTRGTPRKRINGPHHHEVPRLKQMPVSAGLTLHSKPRRQLGDDEIDRMLDRAVAAAEGNIGGHGEESDSEGEIRIPPPGLRRGRGEVGV